MKRVKIITSQDPTSLQVRINEECRHLEDGASVVVDIQLSPVLHPTSNGIMYVALIVFTV
jgi:hypothetical protein